MRESQGRARRCAIYTRKSTDEGLDQAFNSLDAQREACAAYVTSQAHEGWRLDTTIYDDGGFSGGTLERPALTRLLAEISAGRIDVIVVYKIDRLTRSLMDFAKIVDVLDKAGASFVSITQSFNTTSSMGRLTLNVLLSFAQFEREVISERVRDKVAASKAKGMWMGGNIALGYRAENRKLLVVPEEAETVRHIMRTYLEVPSARALTEQLRAEGVVSKVHRRRDGSTMGGVTMGRGALYWLLRNRLYLGETVHKGRVYPGEHKRIVDPELFAAVQAKLAQATRVQVRRPRITTLSLLTGRIRDHLDRPMSPSHSTKPGRRYRYYVSNLPSQPGNALRLSAGELDTAVTKYVGSMLRQAVTDSEIAPILDAASLETLHSWCSRYSLGLETLDPAELFHRFAALDLRVAAQRRSATISISWASMLDLAGVPVPEFWVSERLIRELDLKELPYGQEARVRITPHGSDIKPRTERLADLLAAAFSARDQLEAQTENVGSSTTVRHLQRTARLAYLDPNIIAAIFEGDERLTIGARGLSRLPSLPLSWSEQRKLVGLR
ncbi:MAG: recombinase family protein [Pseudomonadota bacterium]